MGIRLTTHARGLKGYDVLVRLNFLLLISLMVLASTTIAEPARAAEAAPPGGSSLLSGNPLEALRPAGAQRELATVEKIDVAGQAFHRGLRVVTRPGASAEWNVQLQARIDKPVAQGDVILAALWLRCVESMTGDGFIGLVFELGSGDFAKSAERRLTAGSAWRQYFVPFVARRDYAPGEARLCLRLGYDRQTVEIGGVELINYGKSRSIDDLPRTRITYAGRDPDAAWRKEALDRIEKTRKGDLTIRVSDESGKPLTGAKVRATLKRHAFGFGSAVTVEQILGTTGDAKRYREIVETHFNRAVFENDMKWPALYEGISPRTDQALDWLLERNIEVRGHNLHWPSWKWSPKPLRQYENNPDELRRRCAEHVSRTVEHFKGKLIQWDVINEPYSEHDLMDVLGKEVMIDWFKLARATDPQCRLFLNDYGIFDGGPGNPHRKHFYETIAWLKESGAPIDGIGIQSHFSSDLVAPTQLLAVLDQFTELGLPIESTELSLNIDDRALQADYLRDYLVALFSHPNVNGVMLWGFWEGRHWRPQAALLAKDWTPRPQWRAWCDLVDKEWKTDAELVTDSTGVARVRGFCGDYELSVTLPDGKTRRGRARLTREGVEAKL